MSLIQDLMTVLKGGKSRTPQVWDEKIPGMENDPYGKPRLPGVDSPVDPGMGNGTPVSQVRIPRDPGMSFPASTLPNLPVGDQTAPEPIQPADVQGGPAPVQMAGATQPQPQPRPRPGKLTDDMAATPSVDSPGSRPSPGPAPSPQPINSTTPTPVNSNLTPEGLDKDLMEMSAGMPNLRKIYDDSQGQIEAKRASQAKLENPTLGDQLKKFIPALATTAIGAAFGGRRGAIRGAAAGMGYPVGVAARKKLQYETNAKQVETEEGRQDKAVESGIRAREVAARLSEARDYHAATVGVRQQHEDTLGTRYSQQQELNEAKAGLKRGGDGVLRPLPPDQLTEQQKAVLDNTQEGVTLKKSIEDLDAARAELLRSQNDPNSPAYQLAVRKVRAAEYGHQIAAGNLGQKQLEWEFGMHGTQNGEPVPGMLTVDGKPVGGKVAQYNSLTSRQKDTISQAGSVEATGKDLADYIHSNPALFGPFAGRGNMMERIIGSTDPKYAVFQQKFDSFVALHPKLHDFRGINAAKMFDKTYGGSIQNPDALEAAIRGGVGTAGIIKKANLGNRGTVPQPSATPPATANPAAAPKTLSAPEGTRAVQSDGSVKVKKGGKWVTEGVQ